MQMFGKAPKKDDKNIIKEKDVDYYKPKSKIPLFPHPNEFRRKTITSTRKKVH